MSRERCAKSKLEQPRAGYWGLLALGLMGKVIQSQQNMWQCFALAIWCSYSEMLDMKSARMLSRMKISAGANNVENGQSMIPAIGVRLSNAYL
jgi:hypothetical protein